MTACSVAHATWGSVLSELWCIAWGARGPIQTGQDSCPLTLGMYQCNVPMKLSAWALFIASRERRVILWRGLPDLL